MTSPSPSSDLRATSCSDPHRALGHYRDEAAHLLRLMSSSLPVAQPAIRRVSSPDLEPVSLQQMVTCTKALARSNSFTPTKQAPSEALPRTWSGTVSHRWARRDSNPDPPPCKGAASRLPGSARSSGALSGQGWELRRGVCLDRRLADGRSRAGAAAGR